MIVTGCWAVSDREQAAALPGVSAVLGHDQNMRQRLAELLDDWLPPVPRRTPLPQFAQRQTAHQRAFLKVQDGCDAHCTYCIIPQLRATLWSKPLDEAVAEATALVRSGHREIVLTGIFLGAFGQATALRRRQSAGNQSLADLVRALCTRVPGLARLRLSSLEPGDLSEPLLRELAGYEQVVPHFHLPLQSGSDRVLRRMNRQYGRRAFLDLADAIKSTFDRPAITTDIIAGFPGETDADFADTLDVVDSVGFLHVHAFPYSPRPNTAAARWHEARVPTDVARQRVATLNRHADAQARRFITSFVGQNATVLVEQARPGRRPHGRCERYFDIAFDAPHARPGDLLSVRVDAATDTNPPAAVGTVLA